MKEKLKSLINSNATVWIFRILFTILLVYSVCHCYHDYSMIIKGTQEHPVNDFVGYTFKSNDGDYILEFIDSDTCSLKVYGKKNVSLFNEYTYVYEDGTYSLTFNSSYLPAIDDKENDEEDESYKEDLSLVIIEGDVLFLNKYNIYLYIK